MVIDSKTRKAMPVFAGFIRYFPDAMMAIAEFSKKNNEKHNPGQRLHWSKHKSNDHADCAARHLIDIGPDWNAIEPDTGSLHACALAWRSLAVLQIALEANAAGVSVHEYMQKLKEEAANAAA